MSEKCEGWMRAFQSMFGQDATALRLQASSETDSGTGGRNVTPGDCWPGGSQPRGHWTRDRDAGTSVNCPRPHGRWRGGGDTEARPVSPPRPGWFLRLFIAVMVTSGNVSASAAPLGCAPPGRSPGPIHQCGPGLGAGPGPGTRFTNICPLNGS